MNTKPFMGILCLFFLNSFASQYPPYDSEYAKILQVSARKTDLFFTKWKSDKNFPVTIRGQDLYDEISVDVRSLNWLIRISKTHARKKEIDILNDSWAHVGKLIAKEKNDAPISDTIINNFNKIMRTQLELIAKKEEEIRVCIS